MANPFRSTRIQGYILDDGSNVSTPGTPVTPSGLISIVAGGSILVRNKDRNNLMSQFTVGNNSAVGGAIIYVAGLDGIVALPVYPQTVVTLETDSPFRVLNPSNGAVFCVIGQLFLRGVQSVAGAGGASGGGSDSAGGGSGGSGGSGGRLGGGAIFKLP